MTFIRERKNMYRLLILSIVLGTATPALATTQAAAATSRLAPQPRQVLIVRTVVQVTQRHHYPAETLDAKFARNTIKEYIDTLDPGHFYFTRKDVDRFYEQYDDKLAGDLKNGNLEPAFDIYALYNTRVYQRIRYAIGLLVKKPDFNSKDRYHFLRQHVPWPADTQALDRLWKERVENDALIMLLDGKTWTATTKTLKKRYQRALHNLEQTTSDNVFSTYLNAYTQAQDPHSSYFSPFQSQQFKIEMSLHFEGIGAQLSEKDGYATVVRILPGGPAAKNGVLKPGDRITAVGQGKDGKLIDVVGWRLDDIVKKIRGPKHSIVRLKILPSGALPGSDEKILPLVRNTVELNAQRAHGHTVLVKHGNTVYKIGVIDIPSFYVDFGSNFNTKRSPSVTGDVRAIVDRMKKEKISGILLDLRNDGGGSLQQAAALTGLFIPAGPVVQVRNRNGRTQTLPTPSGERVAWNGPLALLVNRFSASATEIFAGAMKDYNRALILGSDTWGKGTVQTLIRLDDFLPGFKAGELKLNIAQFFRVNGASTQRRGIQPDIAIPSAINDNLFGESTYPNALPWKQIPAAMYKPLDDSISQALPSVKKYFKNRVQKEPRYRLFEREVRIRKQMDARTSVSLNLALRTAERSHQRTQELAFDNAWRKLNGEPAFKNVKSAEDARFSAPDIALDASTELLSEYITVASPHMPKFAKLITAIPAHSLTLCLHDSSSQAVSINCLRGDKHKTAIGVFYPPAAASSNGG
jgi:carboxyl-terminal processing protease